MNFGILHRHSMVGKKFGACYLIFPKEGVILFFYEHFRDALRAATVAAESLDFQLAQAILDGANISVPNGYLTECYDELGTQYKVPIYCLSYPINIVKEDNGRDSPAEFSEPIDGGKYFHWSRIIRNQKFC